MATVRSACSGSRTHHTPARPLPAALLCCAVSVSVCYASAAPCPAGAPPGTCAAEPGTPPPPRQSVLRVLQEARADGTLSDSAMRTFLEGYDAVAGGDSTFIREEDVEPIAEPDSLTDLGDAEAVPSATADLLSRTVVLKLNGGLGTSMGLSGPKSLIEVKPGVTFLDLLVRQVTALNAQHGSNASLVLLNSFSTEGATRSYLAQHHPQVQWGAAHLPQSRVPKLAADTLEPVQHPDERLNWCPPGHGDVYAALLHGGWLDDPSKEYIFISNSDNLGATLSPQLLRHFASSGSDFLMEVSRRTHADRKGGHLVAVPGDGPPRLALREGAQCSQADQAACRDHTRHRFFNTNSLWIRTAALRQLLREGLPLPHIANEKTVDPADPASQRVLQLETAMGAAITAFGDRARLVEVGRERFTPVKTCDDLLRVRSDAYTLHSSNSTVALAWRFAGIPPHVSLGVSQLRDLEDLTGGFPGIPQLGECTSVVVRGSAPLRLAPGVVLRGDVVLHVGEGGVPVHLPAGEYTGDVVVHR